MLSRLSSSVATASHHARPATTLTMQLRTMSSTAKVFVDKNTKVICQGFTGTHHIITCAAQRDVAGSE